MIDDEVNIARLLKIHLSEHGYHVRIATNSIEAFRKAISEKPDLITIDMMLTNAGMNLMKRLRKAPETKQIPIMVVTVADNRESCLKAGASCFVQKPFDGEKLVQMVQRLC